MLEQLLKEAVEKEASDIHLSVGLPPVLRIDGRLMQMQKPVLGEEQLSDIARKIVDDKNLDRVRSSGEIDLSHEQRGIGFFRVNIYRQSDSFGIAMRIIKTKIPSLAELGIPAMVGALARLKSGLLLITGPAGSGKSTTLAALTDLINCEQEIHIISLEEPIEFIHTHKKSIITQREIGRDSKSYPIALRAALRQDPNVIIVGEMRDTETIAIAVTAAETGHLVMATLHTNSSAQTVERIINVFPENQQQQIRVQLANSLAGVISQRLLRKKEADGRLPAVEIMVCTPAIRSLIREGKVHQINSFIQSGSRFGMQTMDKHLQTLFNNGSISSSEAVDYAFDREAMESIVKKSRVNV